MAKKSLFKAGMKARIVADAAGHGIMIGTTVTLGRKQGQYWHVPEHGRNVFPSDIGPAVQTADEMKKDLKEAEQEVQSLKAKLKWMKDSKLKEFDPDQFKIWHALQALKGRKSDVDKARLIADIIQGK